jgi:hypothetical protein
MHTGPIVSRDCRIRNRSEERAHKPQLSCQLQSSTKPASPAELRRSKTVHGNPYCVLVTSGYTQALGSLHVSYAPVLLRWDPSSQVNGSVISPISGENLRHAWPPVTSVSCRYGRGACACGHCFRSCPVGSLPRPSWVRVGGSAALSLRTSACAATSVTTQKMTWPLESFSV